MAECRYKGLCRLDYDIDVDVCYPCVGEGTDACFHYKPMPDAKTLLELADGLQSMGERSDAKGRYDLGTTFAAIAARIREALGATDG